MAKTKPTPRRPSLCRIDPCLLATIPEKLDRVIDRQVEMLSAMAVALSVSQQQAETVARHERLLSGNGNRGLVRTAERHDTLFREQSRRVTLSTAVWAGAMVALATLLSAVFAWLLR